MWLGAKLVKSGLEDCGSGEREREREMGILIRSRIKLDKGDVSFAISVRCDLSSLVPVIDEDNFRNVDLQAMPNAHPIHYPRSFWPIL